MHLYLISGSQIIVLAMVGLGLIEAFFHLCSSTLPTPLWHSLWTYFHTVLNFIKSRELMQSAYFAIDVNPLCRN